MPGNHDWYNGLKGLKRQERMVENTLGKKSFLPENGCGIKKVELNDSLTLILIDSKWYITDWDNHPTINEDCDIKTRDRFLEEFSRILKKNRYKNVVVALHHPLYSNGPHGGHFSFKDHMKPLPILGSLKNIIRANAGIQTDNFNKSYAEFIEAIETEVEDFKENVIFVSGHEHNLQYIEKEGVKQIVSGAGSKQSAARAGFEAPFSYGNKGFAKLTFYENGSSVVSYYAANKTDKNKLLFSKEIIPSFKGKTDIDFSEYNQHNKFVEASIYPKSQTDVSGFHKFIWGDLNRDKYGTKVKVPVLELDSVFGGLTPIRQGGGQQTNSLRLENSEGKQYMLRTMEKDGSRIMDGILDDTFLIDVVHDLFTTSDPFAAFVIPDMAKAVHIYHTNPKLYYMPKQPQLGNYNDLFGGKLYLLEERPAHNREDVNSFGNSKDIISTYDVLEKIRKNGKHYIDQDWVIRSRLFDMVIGDWDRHEDQWRWASFEQEDGRTMYRPIPRDRDQPFSRFDGVMIPLIKAFITEVKNMQNFDDDIKDMKWFNYYPKYFDAEFLNALPLEAWQKQATFIQEHLTDEIIEASIKKLPSEIYKIDGAEIISKLKSRRDKLPSIAKRYYERFAKIAYVIGTDKDDVFTVTRVNDAKTKVVISRKNSVLYERIFSNEITKEIQIFGLNGKDTFNVSGDVNDGILLRLVGGQDEDTYNDSSTVSGWSKKTKVYDFKSKTNTLLKNKETADKRSDNYVRNIYNIHDIKNNTTIVIPSLGINPDDGFFFGATATYTKQAYKKYPFGSKQSLGANYFSATSGFEIKYNGEFTEILGKWNLLLNAVATSDNYSINFFGWGNESIYDQKNDLDYYRVKKSELSFSPSLVRRFRGGNSLRFSSSIEGIKIQNTPGRNIEDFEDSAINIFERNYFLGGEVNVNHQRVDEASFPTKGMHFDLSIGAKAKVDDFNRRFGYLKSSLALYKNLVQNRSLVWASEIGTHINFGNRFEFYQAATLGGDRNLRGYNRERFTGKESFYHSNDLRLRFGEIQTGIIPIKIGITGGFDYGRIWSPKEPDNKTWHTSYGGSLWITGVDIITLNVSYFRGNSKEDRIAFSVGFSF
ncbi:ShlB/FhaC/HecB family hemolysin secretion/activation protein [Tenacibaculum sp. SG-28]|uniref:ShlB/FhaC/HecB family hemolysin secretion/activation protein n=1 Tax=Tenacibaculum sp. SG-28 TaxID=754426 RepID=UPI002101AAC6